MTDSKNKLSEPRSAIGLHYDGQNAPIVTVAGIAEVAERIIENAIKAEIPIYENEALLACLSELELGQEIPEELYIVIAQIIAFVYHLKGLDACGKKAS